MAIRLSPRELQVLKMLAEEALVDKEIAERLDCNLGVVKQVSQRMRRKIGATSRLQAAVWWHLHGKLQYSPGS